MRTDLPDKRENTIYRNLRGEVLTQKKVFWIRVRDVMAITLGMLAISACCEHSDRHGIVKEEFRVNDGCKIVLWVNYDNRRRVSGFNEICPDGVQETDSEVWDASADRES